MARRAGLGLRALAPNPEAGGSTLLLPLRRHTRLRVPHAQEGACGGAPLPRNGARTWRGGGLSTARGPGDMGRPSTCKGPGGSQGGGRRQAEEGRERRGEVSRPLPWGRQAARRRHSRRGQARGKAPVRDSAEVQPPGVESGRWPVHPHPVQDGGPLQMHGGQKGLMGQTCRDPAATQEGRARPSSHEGEGSLVPPQGRGALPQPPATDYRSLCIDGSSFTTVRKVTLWLYWGDTRLRVAE